VEILLRFKLEAAGLDAKPDLTFPMPLGERSVPAGRIMIVAVILAICGYGGWYYISTVDRRMPERIAEVPVKLVGARPEPGSASKSPPPKSAGNLAQTRETVAPTNVPGSTGIVKPSETSPKADPSPTPSASQAEAGPTAISPPITSSNALPATTLASTGLSAAESSTGEARRPQTEAASAAVMEGTGQAPRTIPSTQPVVAPSSLPKPSAASAEADVDKPSRVTLRANATSWIQVRAPDQSVLFTGFLKPGDVYRVPDRPGLSMRAGNAGGIDVLVDGKAAPALGPSGAVRNVSLNPQFLMDQDSAPN
jgi:cytoskeleton protein RodZ